MPCAHLGGVLGMSHLRAHGSGKRHRVLLQTLTHVHWVRWGPPSPQPPSSAFSLPGIQTSRMLLKGAKEWVVVEKGPKSRGSLCCVPSGREGRALEGPSPPILQGPEPATPSGTASPALGVEAPASECKRVKLTPRGRRWEGTTHQILLPKKKQSKCCASLRAPSES